MSSRQNQPATMQPSHSSSDEIRCNLKRVTWILSLPPEIIWLILVRLSVETLCTLKCVCRYFSRLISSPKFVEAHLKFSFEDASMSGYRLIVNLAGYMSQSPRNQISFQSLTMNREPLGTLVDPHYPKYASNDSVKLFGSCNGIVFMVCGTHWLLWNPAIRTHIELPSIGRGMKFGHMDAEKGMCLFVNYGFGFDKSNDDYKVVVLFEFEGPVYVVYVYSLKRGTWMKIPDYRGELIYDDFGKFASGHLHWSTPLGDIVSFDVEREVFGTLEQPDDQKSDNDSVLSVLGGSISVSYIYQRHVDVWTMKEYGIKKSWTKMFTLPDQYQLPLSILPNGEVLLDDESYIDAYNLEANKIRLIRIRKRRTPLIYVETLVSPFQEAAAK